MPLTGEPELVEFDVEEALARTYTAVDPDCSTDAIIEHIEPLL